MALRDQLMGQVSGTEPLSQFDPWFSMDQPVRTNPLGTSNSIFNTLGPTTNNPLRNALIGTNSPLAGLAELGGGGGGFAGTDTGMGPSAGMGSSTGSTAGPAGGVNDASIGGFGNLGPSGLATGLGMAASMGLGHAGPVGAALGLGSQVSGLLGGPTIGSLVSNALAALGMNNVTPFSSIDPMVGFNPATPLESQFDPMAWNDLVESMGIEAPGPEAGMGFGSTAETASDIGGTEEGPGEEEEGESGGEEGGDDDDDDGDDDGDGDGDGED